jgi:hypothetical protein
MMIGQKIFLFFFKGTAVCLICRDTGAVFKEFNLKRHFNSKHSDYGVGLNKEELNRRSEDLVRKLNGEQRFFPKLLGSE